MINALTVTRNLSSTEARLDSNSGESRNSFASIVCNVVPSDTT